eukprot:7379515-Prymnesium_polylepis.2
MHLFHTFWLRGCTAASPLHLACAARSHSLTSQRERPETRSTTHPTFGPIGSVALVAGQSSEAGGNQICGRLEQQVPFLSRPHARWPVTLAPAPHSTHTRWPELGP